MEQKKVKLVLDASVIVKWFVQEEYRDRALNLREGHVRGALLLLSPDIVVYEIVNALRYNPELSEEDLRKAVESLFKLHMNLHQPTTELIEKAAENAYKYSISIYDAVYLSLSGLEGCSFITADEKLYEKTSSDKHVMLLQSDLEEIKVVWKTAFPRKE